MMTRLLFLLVLIVVAIFGEILEDDERSRPITGPVALCKKVVELPDGTLRVEEVIC